MTYRVVTAVTAEPVTLAEARMQCRLGSDETDEDSFLTAMLPVVRQYAEHAAERSLAPQVLEAVFDEFPRPDARNWSRPLVLDRPPVVSVTSIKYDDENGVEQTLSTAKYALSLYGDRVRVLPTYGNCWPVTCAKPESVRVAYPAGYGGSGPVLPLAAKQAMLLLIGHYFENRQDVVVGDGRIVSLIVPKAADALLDTFRHWSI
jgi:uncharacterized phiE125 gp8 family phage protein